MIAHTIAIYLTPLLSKRSYHTLFHLEKWIQKAEIKIPSLAFLARGLIAKQYRDTDGAVRLFAQVNFDTLSQYGCLDDAVKVAQQ